MITIYKITDYTKQGKLKKKAVCLFTDRSDNYKQIAHRIKNEGFILFESPYVFTHINAMHPDFGAVVINQDVELTKGQFIMVSPSTLYKELIKN